MYVGNSKSLWKNCKDVYFGATMEVHVYFHSTRFPPTFWRPLRCMDFNFSCTQINFSFNPTFDSKECSSPSVLSFAAEEAKPEPGGDPGASGSQSPLSHPPRTALALSFGYTCHWFIWRCSSVGDVHRWTLLAQEWLLQTAALSRKAAGSPRPSGGLTVHLHLKGTFQGDAWSLY